MKSYKEILGLDSQTAIVPVGSAIKQSLNAIAFIYSLITVILRQAEGNFMLFKKVLNGQLRVADPFQIVDNQLDTSLFCHILASTNASAVLLIKDNIKQLRLSYIRNSFLFQPIVMY